MAAFTYIVRCADGTLYTGWTDDIEKRLAAHNSGHGAKYTRPRRPVTLVHLETFATKEEAMSREWHIKRLSRAQKLALVASSRGSGDAVH
ncbi:MAG: GIY-YIG nuclease family protein [Selenomonas sp.]|uniref:GIY-YIG nuclease family protein n=1 Tax=Selenomonas sp. TaxID=2053611 RepID=UPI0025DC8A36|nr:GIY-YIG nuclease family protein [Selenomonas sp.]MCI6101235.1 GIY-YIG nuclease family protein [Selenomonas sp.]MCI6231121.1 GIY-YIG nuclease family protein [Selenomonas sp.]